MRSKPHGICYCFQFQPNDICIVAELSSSCGETEDMNGTGFPADLIDSGHHYILLYIFLFPAKWQLHHNWDVIISDEKTAETRCTFSLLTWCTQDQCVHLLFPAKRQRLWSPEMSRKGRLLQPPVHSKPAFKVSVFCSPSLVRLVLIIKNKNKIICLLVCLFYNILDTTKEK